MQKKSCKKLIMLLAAIFLMFLFLGCDITIGTESDDDGGGGNGEPDYGEGYDDYSDEWEDEFDDFEDDPELFDPATFGFEFEVMLTYEGLEAGSFINVAVIYDLEAFFGDGDSGDEMPLKNTIAEETDEMYEDGDEGEDPEMIGIAQIQETSGDIYIKCGSDQEEVFIMVFTSDIPGAEPEVGQMYEIYDGIDFENAMDAMAVNIVETPLIEMTGPDFTIEEGFDAPGPEGEPGDYSVSGTVTISETVTEEVEYIVILDDDDEGSNGWAYSTTGLVSGNSFDFTISDVADGEYSIYTIIYISGSEAGDEPDEAIDFFSNPEETVTVNGDDVSEVVLEASPIP